MKKIIFSIIAFILLVLTIQGALAVDYTTNNIVWNTFNAASENDALKNWANESNNFTNNGATLTTGFAGYYDFDGTGDTMITGSSFGITTTDPRTICIWVNSDDVTGDRTIANLGDCSTAFECYSPNFYATNYRTVFKSDQTQGTGTLTTGTDYHLCSAYDGTTTYAYVDGVEDGTATRNLITEDSQLTLGDYVWTGYHAYYDGKMYSVQLWDSYLNSTEISELTTNGKYYNPYVPPTFSNDSTESTAVVKQLTSVDINTPTLTTIISTTYNITQNSTELYGVYNFNVEPNINNQIYCQLTINGVIKANSTRTNTAGDLGSMSLMTEHFSQDIGEHTQSLECSRIGAGKITISNVIGIGHILLDENGLTIPHDSVSLNQDVTSGATYTNIGGLKFLVSNTTIASDLDKHLVVEWSASYTNNDISDEKLNTYLTLGNFTCSSYPRDVSSGSTGSVSGDCLFKNVTSNKNYTIKTFVNGTNATYEFDIIIKEFVLGDDEISGGQGLLVGSNFTGSSDVMLVNITGGNLHHGLTNVFEKQAYSILTNESTTVTMYILLNNSVDLRTVDMTRGFNANEVGVMIGHDVFEGVPQDNYTIQVWANCGSPTAKCTIVGGAGIGYITDVTTTIFNGFYIQAYDLWDKSVINNFTAVDGVTFTTTTNNISYYTEEELVTFTLTSLYNGGYFNVTYVDYNTSNNLNASMFQSIIDFTCWDKNIQEISCENSTIYASAGTHNFTIHANYSNNPYYNNTQEVTINALDNKTVNITGFYNKILGFTDDVTSNLINGLTCTLESSTITFESTSYLHISTATLTGNKNLTCYKILFYPESSWIMNNTQERRNYSLSEFRFKAYFSAPVNGSLTDVVQSQEFDNTSIILKMSSFPTGVVTLRWSKNNTNISQKMEFFNSQDESITVYLKAEDQELEDYRVVRVFGDGQLLENSRVVAEEWNGTDYIIVYGGLTNVDGETGLFLKYNVDYRITAQANGFTTKQSILSTALGETSVFVIKLVSSAAGDSNYLTSNCYQINYNTTCYYQVLCGGSDLCSTVGITYNITYNNGSNEIINETVSTTTGNTFEREVKTNVNSIIVTSEIDSITEDTLVTRVYNLDNREMNNTFTNELINETESNTKVWIFGVIIIGVIIGGLFEKKVKKGTGIWATTGWLIIWGTIIKILLIPVMIIGLFKISLMVWRKVND